MVKTVKVIVEIVKEVHANLPQECVHKVVQLAGKGPNVTQVHT